MDSEGTATQRPGGATRRRSTSCSATKALVRSRESRKESQDSKAKLEPPPADLIQQERRKAIDTVRRAMAQPGVPMANKDNPLGLPLGADGQAPTLKIVALEGEGAKARRVLSKRFCNFLATREEYVQVFNQFPQHQQIAAILIQEEWEDQPNLIKDHYLRASKHLLHTTERPKSRTKQSLWMYTGGASTIRLLTYARSTPDIDPSATAGLGTMQHEITNQKQETIRGIQNCNSSWH